MLPWWFRIWNGPLTDICIIPCLFLDTYFQYTNVYYFLYFSHLCNFRHPTVAQILHRMRKQPGFPFSYRPVGNFLYMASHRGESLRWNQDYINVFSMNISYLLRLYDLIINRCLFQYFSHLCNFHHPTVAQTLHRMRKQPGFPFSYRPVGNFLYMACHRGESLGRNQGYYINT